MTTVHVVTNRSRDTDDVKRAETHTGGHRQQVRHAGVRARGHTWAPSPEDGRRQKLKTQEEIMVENLIKATKPQI